LPTPAKTTYSRRTGSARPVIHRSFHMGAIPGASVFEFCGQRSYPWHPDLPASNLGRSGNCTCGLLGSLCCWSRPGLGGNHTILGGLPSQSASNSWAPKSWAADLRAGHAATAAPWHWSFTVSAMADRAEPGTMVSQSPFSAEWSSV